LAVPKKKKSQSKTRMRRSQYKVELPQLVKCKNCGEPVLPHRVCRECGYYDGKQVIPPKKADKS